MLGGCARPPDVIVGDVGAARTAVLTPEVAGAVGLVGQLADVVQHLVAVGSRALVAAAPDHQGRAVAEPLGTENDRLIENVRGLGVGAVPAAGPLLIDADTVLVAEIVELLGLHQSAAPGAEVVDPRVTGAGEDAVVVLAGEAHHGIRGTPARALHVDVLAVDDEDTVVGVLMLPRGQSLVVQGADSEVRLGVGHGTVGGLEGHLHGVQVLVAVAARPPQLEVGDIATVAQGGGVHRTCRDCLGEVGGRTRKVLGGKAHGQLTRNGRACLPVQLDGQIHRPFGVIHRGDEGRIQRHGGQVPHRHRLPDAKREELGIVPAVGAVEDHGVGVVLGGVEMHHEGILTLLDGVRHVHVGSAEHTLVGGDLLAVEVDIRHVAQPVKGQLHPLALALVGEGAQEVPALLAVLVGGLHVVRQVGILDHPRVGESGVDAPGDGGVIGLVPALARRQVGDLARGGHLPGAVQGEGVVDLALGGSLTLVQGHGGGLCRHGGGAVLVVGLLLVLGQIHGPHGGDRHGQDDRQGHDQSQQSRKRASEGVFHNFRPFFRRIKQYTNISIATKP